MSIQPCRACGQSVPPDASFCPNCGVANPTTPLPPLDSPGKKVRWPWIAVGVVVLVGLCTTFTSKPTDTARQDAPPVALNPPRLLITLEKVEYDHGYFKIFGIAKNVGESDAKAPLVQLEVWTDDAQRTLLGRGTAAPIGYLGKVMSPGNTGAFELMVRVPGERSRVRWQVSSNLPHEVKDTSKK